MMGKIMQNTKIFCFGMRKGKIALLH